MKKLLSAILLALSLILIVSCGENGESDVKDPNSSKAPAVSVTDSLGFVLTETTEGTYSVTDYVGQSTNITVPASYNGLLVTSIDAYAFQNCTTLLNVVIPEGITAIGENAFDSCTNLMRISIPASIEDISQSAFLNCNKLVQITNLSEEKLSFLPNTPGLEILTSADETFTNFLQTYTDADKNTKVVYDKNGVITYTVKESVGESVVETVYLMAYKGAAKELDLSSYKHVDVIYDRAFYQNATLTGITLPANLLLIGEEAFKDCTSLKTVRFAEDSQLAYISWGTFEGCTALTTVNLPASLVRIGVASFKNCTVLADIKIPLSVERIGEEAFSGCAALKSVSFDENGVLESIGDSAFSGCKALTGITLPASVKSIAFGAFKDCTALASITLPFIGESADGILNTHFGYIFGASSWKTQGAVIPATLKAVVIKDYASVISEENLPTHTSKIGTHAFDGCTTLTSIEISPCVKEIGKDAFNGCASLANVTYKTLSYKATALNEKGQIVKVPAEFASQLKNIYAGAFKNCTGLTKITVPANVKFIASGAYEGCTNAKGVYISDVGAWCAIDFEDKDANPLSFIHKLYVGESTTPVTDLVIPENTETIGKNALAGLDGLKTVLIPLTMKEIADFAFADCKELKAIYYAGSAETWTDLLKIKDADGNEIGTRNNEDLASVTIYYFSDTKPLFEGNYWYYDAKAKIAIWPSVSGGDEDAGDTPVVTPDTPTNAPGKLVYELNSKGDSYIVVGYTGKLTTVTIPATYEGKPVKEISDDAFYQCTTLTSIEIPASIKNISYEAFRGCTSLKNVTFGAGTKTIELWAFAYCSSLTSIVIPTSVTAIEDYAFHGSTALKNIYYSGSASDWAKVTVNLNEDVYGTATVYFYSAKAPTKAGNYWHYNASGAPIAW